MAASPAGITFHGLTHGEAVDFVRRMGHHHGSGGSLHNNPALTWQCEHGSILIVYRAECLPAVTTTCDCGCVAIRYEDS